MNISIAVTANLDSTNSVHSTTFKRAVNMAVDWLSSKKINIHLIWVNDRANEKGGLEAASHIVKTSAQVVVGHFASSAALAAAPIYANSNISLFLPAATASILTKYNNVFRICDNDSDYLIWIYKWFKNNNYQCIHIETDESAHAKSILDKFKKLAPASFLKDSMQGIDAIFFCGLFENGLSFLKRTKLKNVKLPVFLTDDMQSESLGNHSLDLPEDISIFGFTIQPDTLLALEISKRYYAAWGQYPGIYFYETFAAMQIAVEFPQKDTVETILGKITFNKQGESRPKRFCLYRLMKRELIPLERF